MTISVRLCGGLQEETTKPRVSHNRLGKRIDILPGLQPNLALREPNPIMATSTKKTIVLFRKTFARILFLRCAAKHCCTSELRNSAICLRQSRSRYGSTRINIPCSPSREQGQTGAGT